MRVVFKGAGGFDAYITRDINMINDNLTIMAEGQPLPSIAGWPEGCIFSMIDDGMYFIVNFAAPTDEEIKQVRSGEGFEIRYAVIENILMITVKLGKLHWMDAPFSPHLEVSAGRLHVKSLDTGKPLTIILTDAKTTVMKVLRMVGISASFSASINMAVKRMLNMPFSSEEYDARLQSIINRYSTEKLVTMGHPILSN